MVVDEVTTLTGPGELIDVIVTERGICINPQRTDLLQAVRDAGHLPLLDIRQLKKQVEVICGGEPEKAKHNDHAVAVVKWVDGTLLDTVWESS